MSIQFQCSHCARRYKVPDNFAGRTAKCKACGQATKIPAAQVQATREPEPDAVPLSMAAEEDEVDPFASALNEVAGLEATMPQAASTPSMAYSAAPTKSAAPVKSVKRAAERTNDNEGMGIGKRILKILWLDRGIVVRYVWIVLAICLIHTMVVAMNSSARFTAVSRDTFIYSSAIIPLVCMLWVIGLVFKEEGGAGFLYICLVGLHFALMTWVIRTGMYALLISLVVGLCFLYFILTNWSQARRPFLIGLISMLLLFWPIAVTVPVYTAMHGSLDKNEQAERMAALDAKIQREIAASDRTPLVIQGLPSNPPPMSTSPQPQVPVRVPDKPVDPQTLAAGLKDRPYEVKYHLIRMGRAAEVLVLPYADDPNLTTRQVAIEILGQIGGEASVPVLLGFLDSSDGATFQYALAALKRIKPEVVDPITVSLKTLKSERTNEHSQAVQALATQPVVANRINEVASFLEEAAPLAKQMDRRHYVAALVAWRRPESQQAFINVISVEDVDVNTRRPAINALASYPTAESAEAVARWVIKESDAAVTALIAIGPVGEPHVLPLLNNRDTNAQSSAIRVLESIGTQQTIAQLQRFIQGSRDRRNLDLAGDAIRSIRAREQAAKEAAKPK